MAVLNYLMGLSSSFKSLELSESNVFTWAADHFGSALQYLVPPSNHTKDGPSEFGFLRPLQGLAREAADTYDHYLDLGDPRVADWPLMSSPWPTLLIAAAYVALCRLACTRARTPLLPDAAVKPLLVAYNAANVALNAYIARELLLSSRDYNLTCQPVDYSRGETAMRAAAALWWYFALKGLELADSAFFAVRGKAQSHLTFLHVYHHSTMFCLWWIGVKYVAGGSAVFGALTNCLVHVLMYTHYTAALLVSDKRTLWWKRYLTMLQMAQFVAAIVMGVNGIRVDCDFPRWMQYAMVAYMISFLGLFGNFYSKQYNNKMSKRNSKVD